MTQYCWEKPLRFVSIILELFLVVKCITGNWKNAKYSARSLARSGGNFVRKAYISEEAANELKWWIRNIFDALTSIKLPTFDLTIFFDASLEGWGDTDQVTEIGGR